MNLVNKFLLVVSMLCLVAVFPLYGQNDSIPDTQQDTEVIDTRETQTEPVEPSSVKKPVGDRSPFRNRRFNPKYGIRSFLNKFTFTPLMGYSRTYYREKVSSTEEPSDFNGSGIPISGTLNFHFDRFRIGAGAGMEFHSIKEPEVAIAQGIINDKNTLFTKFYGNIGAEVYQYWDYMLVPEVQIGKLNLGKGFNADSVNNGMFVNLGVSIEKIMSEYFRVIIKPSYEIRSLEKTGTEMADYRMNGFSVKLGVSIRYPDLPRCPLKACHTQIKHIHYGNEYRGQPLPIKQNRKYGELNPKLKKYKGRNKRKLNPY
ncbi:MAG: hypothetical protein DHS20C17_30730 [Cyclobacteriaceae bacterium]|nr:MAG: hypothetical protein DHS20C17_30730 [Cyclobacteriaceae bacterium]